MSYHSDPPVPKDCSWTPDDTVKHCLPANIQPEKQIMSGICYWANILEYTYTNLMSRSSYQTASWLYQETCKHAMHKLAADTCSVLSTLNTSRRGIHLLYMLNFDTPGLFTQASSDACKALPCDIELPTASLSNGDFSALLDCHRLFHFHHIRKHCMWCVLEWFGWLLK